MLAALGTGKNAPARAHRRDGRHAGRAARRCIFRAEGLHAAAAPARARKPQSEALCLGRYTPEPPACLLRLYWTSSIHRICAQRGLCRCHLRADERRLPHLLPSSTFPQGACPALQIQEDKPLTTIIGVRFKSNGKMYYFDPQDTCGVTAGTGVIVETARGLEYGECVQGNTERERAVGRAAAQAHAARIATEADLKTLERQPQARGRGVYRLQAQDRGTRAGHEPGHGGMHAST